MKQLPVKYFLALGAALFAFHTPVMAASSEELTEIRSQLRNLMERVERLEQENDVLRERSEALQAKGEAPKSVTSGPREESAAQVDNAHAAGWVERVAFNGDLRYRYEQICDDTLNASGVRDAAP